MFGFLQGRIHKSLDSLIDIDLIKEEVLLSKELNFGHYMFRFSSIDQWLSLSESEMSKLKAFQSKYDITYTLNIDAFNKSVSTWDFFNEKKRKISEIINFFNINFVNFAYIEDEFLDYDSSTSFSCVVNKIEELISLCHKLVNFSIETSREAKEVLNYLPKNINLTIDIGNYVCYENNFYEDFFSFKEKIGQIHIKDKDSKCESVKLGEGLANFDNFKDLLDVDILLFEGFCNRNSDENIINLRNYSNFINRKILYGK